MQLRSVGLLGVVFFVSCSSDEILTRDSPPTVSFPNDMSSASRGGSPTQVGSSQPVTSTAPGSSSMVGGSAGSASPPVAMPVGMNGPATSGAGANPMTAAAGSGAVTMPPPGSATPEPSGPPGISVDSQTGEVVFRTAPVELKASEESYVCYAVTLQEGFVIDGFSQTAQKFVHHAQLVETLLPETDGLFPCPEQFKLTWMPVFLAGTGASELRFDEGVGHSMPAGTQLMLQMHLFNTSDQAARKTVEIRMHKSASPNPTPVTPWAIGSSEIEIPPRQSGSAQNICTQGGSVEVLAVFPHMHQLGKKMTVEVGKTMGSMRMLYARDPFNFNDQHMEKMRFKLEAGDLLRVTCDFATNLADNEVVWGESSTDEMCQFVGFALGDAPAQADCPKLWDKIFGL